MIQKFLHLSGPLSVDLVILASIFIILYGYSIYAGRNRLLAFIISFYPATLLFNTFPLMNKVLILQGDKFLTLNKLAIFLLFFIPINIIINRFIFTGSDYSGFTGLVRGAGLSLSALIMVLLFSYSTLNLDVFHNFSPQIDTIFAHSSSIFYWNLASLALLAIL